MWFKQPERSFTFSQQKTESLTPTLFVFGPAIARTKHGGIYRILQRHGCAITRRLETTPREIICRITNYEWRMTEVKHLATALLPLHLV